MLKKKLSIVFVLIFFVFSLVFLIPHEKTHKVLDVESPLRIIFSDSCFKIEDLDTFDSSFSEKNKVLAEKLNISEEEAFILGNLAKYWAENLIKDRNVVIKNKNDIIYYRYSYRSKFLYSGFCVIDSKPFYKEAFEKRLAQIRRAKYKVLDLETNKIYEISDNAVRNLNHFIVMRKSHLNKLSLKKFLDRGNLKLFLTDSTTKLKPDRDCSTLVCKEILNNINLAKKTIDMAIYGYSEVPEIEHALVRALKRGVKIRLVYDLDSKGENIYPDTEKLLSIIKNSKNDGTSSMSRNIMHNKFYIFDDRILITGSANLSHTDMSGYNTNSVIIIDSTKVAKIYKKEFEQMYNGKFHADKCSFSKDKISINGIDLEVYFSPQDKSLTNAVLPLIRNAKKYIYIPSFVLTEKRVTEELIKAKQRGVDVRVISDDLNASIRHSKHQELRDGGISVKTENYAGKMHSKSMLIDDKYTIIGSMNFSNSGENYNDENHMVIKDDSITKFYKDFFHYQWEQIDEKWLKTNVRAESKDSIGSCFDGIDNNYDGLVDINDPACK